MNTAIVPEAVTRVTEETHARAVLARLAGAHHLPIAADGIEWVTPVGEWAPGKPYNFPPTLRVEVPAADDVETWAAAVGARIEREDWIGDYTPTVWICRRTVRVVVVNWLPGVTLWVNHSETRKAPRPAKRRTR